MPINVRGTEDLDAEEIASALHLLMRSDCRNAARDFDPLPLNFRADGRQPVPGTYSARNGATVIPAIPTSTNDGPDFLRFYPTHPHCCMYVGFSSLIRRPHFNA